jgi:hypothetical protein
MTPATAPRPRPRTTRPAERWAALDIGSDTIHLLVADPHRGPSVV